MRKNIFWATTLVLAVSANAMLGVLAQILHP